MSDVEEFMQFLNDVEAETDWRKKIDCKCCGEVKEVPATWRLKLTCKGCFEEWKEKYTKG